MRVPGFLTRRPSTQALITGGVVGAVVLFVFSQLQPSLLFANTTPSGGDMGAHVWLPAYLRDHLLPHGRIAGWTPDWYAGFPALTFYFPLPSLLIVLVDVVLPYGIAFKLVTVLGVLALPVAAYLFGRLSGLAFPGPALLAVATLPFLFDRSWTIYGGNIPSTLAGEFSFTISLATALVFLGVVARGLETGRHRALAAVLLAITGLCHVIPTIFALTGAGVFMLMRLDRRRVRFVVTAAGIAGLLAAFWLLPFYVRLPYTNDMGWEKIHEYGKNLFPHNLRWALALAAAGAVSAMALWRRTGIAIVALAVIWGGAFRFAPEGRLWNARFLPFWYLCIYFLAALAIAEVAQAIGSLISGDPERPWRWSALVAPVAGLAAALLIVAPPLERGRKSAGLDGGVLRNLSKVLPASTDSSFIPSWVKWNYTGYERKPSYPEYHALIQTMAKLPCGRAMWEYDSKLDRYGTPMALMLLPYWTKGCIGSMEGLYFESAATTPYHFLNAAELSKAPSNPQRDLPYGTLDVNKGVGHLQMMGARYYMAFSPEALAEARANRNLQLVASSPPWEIFEVAGSQLAVPLTNLPAVVEDAPGKAKPWLDVAVPWYTDASRWNTLLAADGPKNWPRVKVRRINTSSKTAGSGVQLPELPARPSPTATVTRVRSSDDRISFDIDRPGVPVLVKASYFPNWKTSGAKGPWRVAPNLMVVVPTGKHVSLHYGFTPPEIGGWLFSLLGIVLLVQVARRDRSLMPISPQDGSQTDQPPDGPDGPPDDRGARRAPLGDDDRELGRPLPVALGADDELGVEQVASEPAPVHEGAEGVDAHGLHPVGVGDAQPEADAEDGGEHTGDEAPAGAPGVDRAGTALGGDDKRRAAGLGEQR